MPIQESFDWQNTYRHPIFGVRQSALGATVPPLFSCEAIVAEDYLDLQHQRSELKIAALLERLAALIRASQQLTATVHGLTPLQLEVLVFVHTHERSLARVGKLAEEFLVSQPTVSDAIRTLVDKELIKAERSAEDGRIKQLLLTGQGKRLAARVRSWSAPLEAALLDIPADMRLDLQSGLMELVQAMRRAGLISVDRMCFSCRFLAVLGTESRPRYHCQLLDVPLTAETIRVDCPEHEPA